MPYEYSPNAVYSEAAYRETMKNPSGPETACMDPYTTQITNRLAEADKYLAEITIQLSRIADKLVGGAPEAALSGSDKVPLKPTSVGMMEQIVGQANILNRKIHNLGDTVNRLQSL